MTNLRARLADALQKHSWAASGMGCACGYECFQHEYEHHRADVLLSLPVIAIADRDTLNDLLELHKPTIWSSAPFSRDGTTDDLCCLTCDRLGDRHTWTTPSWPCQTRQLLDALANAEEKHD